MGKCFNAYSDLDLDPMKLYIELVRAIFIYYNVFRFRFLDQFLFELSCKNTHTHKHRRTHTHTHTHTDSNEYPIVAFSKNATIINVFYGVIISHAIMKNGVLNFGKDAYKYLIYVAVYLQRVFLWPSLLQVSVVCRSCRLGVCARTWQSL